MSNKDIVHFITEAKKNAYASGGGLASKPTRPGAKDIPYQKDKWSYLDSYYGELDFMGEEVVWEQDRAIWGMNYRGDTYEEIAGFPQFLLEALMRVPDDAPYRGPKHYANGPFEYFCEWSGSVESFHGNEYVTYEGSRIYSLHFHGGKISYT